MLVQEKEVPPTVIPYGTPSEVNLKYHPRFGVSKAQDSVDLVPINAHSSLDKLDEFVMIGQAMGHKMQGYINNVEEIINHHGRNIVNSGIVIKSIFPYLHGTSLHAEADPLHTLWGVWSPLNNGLT
ncbi:hypothetical protein LXL04_021174 [Taraxacum kok-saghyz]